MQKAVAKPARDFTSLRTRQVQTGRAIRFRGRPNNAAVDVAIPAQLPHGLRRSRRNRIRIEVDTCKPKFHHPKLPTNKLGYTQLDKALHHAAWHPLDSSESHSMAFCQPNTRMLSWDQSDVAKEQYQFKSKQEAATCNRERSARNERPPDRNVDVLQPPWKP